MELFLRATAAVILAVILGLSLGKQGKDIGILLTIAVCCMVAMIALQYMEPVVDFLDSLEDISRQSGTVGILLKATGIALIAEIAGLVSSDAGNSSLGKIMQLLGAAVILWLSIPVFTSLMELIQQILGEV